MRPARQAARAGYTLIELMIVVAIIGILAAVAVPAFMAQMQRSRTAEAFSVIGEIREAQDAYYATFSRYCGPLTWNPTTFGAGGTMQRFVPAAAGWDQLGASPEGEVRFRYQVLAGVPGTTPPGIPGFSGADHWYVIQAEGDLDGDGATVAFEAYSAHPQIYVSAGVGGAYLRDGWE